MSNARAADRQIQWWFGLSGLVMAGVVAGCGRQPPGPSPTAPTGPTPTTSNAQLSGHAIDADTEQPLAGATVTTTYISVPARVGRRLIKPPQPATAVTDGNGRYEINATFPDGWSDPVLGVRKPGYESSDTYYLERGNVLRVYPTLTIAAGQTIDTRIFLGNYVCGWESWLCRRVVVAAGLDELLDVEVTPIDDPFPFGIVIGEPPLTENVPPTRVTSPAGEVWLLSNGRREARVRVAARRHSRP